MAYAAAIIAGVTAIVSIVGTVASSKATEEAGDKQADAMLAAGEEAKAIGEQERVDQLKSSSEARAIAKSEVGQRARDSAFVRKRTLAADQRAQVGEAAGILQNAAGEDKLFRDLVRGKRR